MTTLIVIGIVFSLVVLVVLASPTARHILGTIVFEIIAEIIVMRFGRFLPSRKNGKEDLGFYRFVDYHLPAKRLANNEVQILGWDTIQPNQELAPAWNNRQSHFRVCPNHGSPYIPQLHWVHCDDTGNLYNVLG